MTSKQNNIVLAILGVGFFVCLFNLFKPHYNQLPYGMHNWAQSDRYSVAVQYLDNNNFFKARTHNLSTVDGRVGVEFPLIQYTSAKISNLFGNNFLPFVYRLSNLLLLLGGLFFFTKQWNTDKITKTILAFALFFSPVILFYSFNFLPDITGLGFLLFGFGFVVKFIQKHELKQAFLSLLFLGIATLVKTTSGIFLLAVGGSLCLHFLRPVNWKKLFAIGMFTIGMVAVVFLYDYFYFHKVNEDFYSRIFMSQKQPITDLSSWKALVRAFKFWHGQYLTWPQTILIVGLIAARPFFFKSRIPTLLKYILIISTIGLIGFTFLMGKQYSDHDYYFITSWIPLFILIAFSFAPTSDDFQKKRVNWILQIGVAIFMVITAIQSMQQYSNRMLPEFTWKNRPISTDIEWMLDGQKELDNLGIPETDIIFVGYDAAPNTSLVYFNRMGKAFNHEEMTRDSANMSYWMARIRPNYFIVPAVWNANLAEDQPVLYKQLVPFASRTNYVIYKPMY